MLILLVGGTCERGSNAMLYIPNFIKIGSGIQKSLGGIHTLAHT
jgi:hypothetical protein